MSHTVNCANCSQLQAIGVMMSSYAIVLISEKLFLNATFQFCGRFPCESGCQNPSGIKPCCDSLCHSMTKIGCFA